MGACPVFTAFLACQPKDESAGFEANPSVSYSALHGYRVGAGRAAAREESLARLGPGLSAGTWPEDSYMLDTMGNTENEAPFLCSSKMDSTGSLTVH